MRIAVVANYYSTSMGYIQNCLPHALSRLGHEVTLVASTLQPYGLSPFYRETYEPFLGPPVVTPGTSVDRGVPVRRLPYFAARGRLGLRGLSKYLRQLHPDVVEVVDHASITALQAAWSKRRVGFKLFTANHVLASVFPPAWNDRPGPLSLLRLEAFSRLPGRLVSRASEACYAPTADAGDLAIRFFGVDEGKVRYLPLGVDTEIFHPIDGRDDHTRRQDIREGLGAGAEDILCIYTGRLNEDKGPEVLARAVELLRRQGHPYRGLFIGQGEREKRLREYDGASVIPFMPYTELGSYYRSADIGVWPKQESTSMLDASACALPIVVSDRVQAADRVEGSGITYTEGKEESLAAVLLHLKERAKRESLGAVGAKRMANELSWDEIARRRAMDYQAAMTEESAHLIAGRQNH